MTQFQISPKVRLWITFVAAAVVWLSLAGTQLPLGIPDQVVADIKSWATFLGAFYLGVLNPFLPAFASSEPGPLAPRDPPSVVQATKLAVATGEK